MNASSPSSDFTYDVSTLVSFDYFGYTPSLSLAAVALALYLVATIIIAIQNRLARNPNAKHMILVTITGLTEAGGYAALIYLIQNSGKTSIYGAFVAMQVLIVLSPNLLQAANYATASSVVRLSGMSAQIPFLRPIILTTTFIILDIVALCVQAFGIALWASSKSSGHPNQQRITLGSWITVGGLGMQLASFAAFSVLAAWIQRKNSLRNTPGQKKLFIGLYLTIILVTIRNVYRFTEFVQGAILIWPYSPNEYILSEKQYLFYCLDTLPILLCFVCYIAFNPSNLLPKTKTLTSSSLANHANNASPTGNTSNSIKMSDKDNVDMDVV